MPSSAVVEARQHTIPNVKTKAASGLVFFPRFCARFIIIMTQCSRAARNDVDIVSCFVQPTAVARRFVLLKSPVFIFVPPDSPARFVLLLVF